MKTHIFRPTEKLQLSLVMRFSQPNHKTWSKSSIFWWQFSVVLDLNNKLQNFIARDRLTLGETCKSGDAIYCILNHNDDENRVSLLESSSVTKYSNWNHDVLKNSFMTCENKFQDFFPSLSFDWSLGSISPTYRRKVVVFEEVTLFFAIQLKYTQLYQ